MKLFAAFLLLCATAFAGDPPVYGPSNTPIPDYANRSLSFDHTGATDVFWTTRYANQRRPVVIAPLPHITIECKLSDGRVYTAEFPSGVQGELLEVTQWSQTRLRWSMFKGADGQILGAHLITTADANGIVLCAVNVSNGAIDAGDFTSFCGGVYYDTLILKLDGAAYAIEPDFVRRGERIVGKQYQFVSPGGHYFPERFQFTRRFALYPRSVEGNKQQLARALLSRSGLRFPDTYSGFGPSKSTFDRASEESQLSVEHEQRTNYLKQQLAFGTANPSLLLYHDAMGPFMPLLFPMADDVGGEKIEFVSGWNISRKSANYHVLQADLLAERMPVCAFDKITGKPLNWYSYPKPFEYRLTRGYTGIVQIPHFWALPTETWGVFAHKKFNSGSCAYENDLYNYYAFDDAHLIRGYGDVKASWWLARDWIARLRMEMYSADVQTSWTLAQNDGYEPQYPGEWVAFSLGERLHDAAKNPGKGGFYGRAAGWSWDCVVTSYAAGIDRARSFQWLQKVYELAGLVALPTGIAYNMRYPDGDNQIPWNDYGLDHKYGEAPYFQVPIFANAIFDIWQSARPGMKETAMHLICESARQVHMGKLPKVVSEYGNDTFGPNWYLVTSENDVPVQELRMGVAKSHWMHSFSHLAQAYRMSGDNAFLTTMLSVGFPATTKAEKIAQWEATTNQIYTAEALAILKRSK